MSFDRRNFLKGGLALSAAAITPARVRADDAFRPTPGAWRTFEITTQIDIPAPQGVTQAWIPLPSVTASDWIRPQGNTWKLSSGRAKALKIGRYGTQMLHVAWPDGQASGQVVSRVSARDRSVDFTTPTKPAHLSAAEHTLYLSPTKLIPTDGIVKQKANEIVAGATADEDKARLIYEWVVANTFRNPATRGCGLGNISFMLETGDLGGKCADINALFVGLARASGIPARDLYGIRVAPSQFGYKSLGANSSTITKSQHCRTEVYLNRWGWVPVDAADVRKVALEEPPGKLPMDSPQVEAAHKTLFGAWEGNWIAYNHGHDVALPGSAHQPIPFLMYPQAETVAGVLDCLDADAFKYAITAKEI